MAKKGETKMVDKKQRGTLTEENVVTLIEKWEESTTGELAAEFGVAESTVINAAAKIRKMSGGKACRTRRAKKEDLFKKVLSDKNLI